MKKVPIRRCSGCHQQKFKTDLIRIVKNRDGLVEIDLTGKKNGRGAYICKSSDCFKKMKKAKKLDRNLSITIDDSIYNELEKMCYEQ